MAEHDYPADLCLKCSACNTVCPVYAVNENFRGPKSIGPETARLMLSGEVGDDTAGYCTGCRQCELACPAGVPITHLAAVTKGKKIKTEGISLRDWVLGHNQWVSGTASRLAPLANWALSLDPVLTMAEIILGIQKRPFPLYNRPFVPAPAKTGSTGLKVAYFTGCYARYNQTSIAWAVVDVLERCGVQVTVPAQKCCGVPLMANGLVDEAKKYGAFNLRVFAKLISQGYQIVTSCPSCALCWKQDYPDLNLPQAQEMAGQVWDIADYLISHDLLRGHCLLPQDEKYFYHQPCHTKAQGIGIPGRDILRDILDLPAAEQKCCGQSGTYGFKKEKYTTSEAIAGKLFQDVSASGASGVVTECGMCSLQLAKGTGLPVYHPLEILQAALRPLKAGEEARG